MSYASQQSDASVYVPLSRAERPKEAGVSSIELRRSVRSVFRRLAWDGMRADAPVEAEPGQRPGASRDGTADRAWARRSARSVFRAVPWVGVKQAEMTERQLQKSVGRVLAEFGWE